LSAHHFAILWASVGNTVPATFWAMYYLVSHPEALQVVRQEIHDVLRLSGVEFSRDRDVTLSREQLDKLLYLESAINESLRLSSASMNIRVAQEDFSLRLDGERSVAVRKGDIIALYPQSMHMDPEIYEEPQTFRLDRYIQDGREKTDFYKNGQKLKYYRMPFGSGSSMCPGRHFAINEIKQFLCLLLLYFDLQLEEGQPRATLDPSRAGMGILLPTRDVRFRYRLQTVQPGQ
ncbi:cytochrome P450 7A1-like, partial [Micropterus dolomieu]|uniref:cytochrome P450 7A1-like n=1 Tax=Micropterus dolomieu TaxID=147949 RepID=UPI001E8EE309